MNSFKEIFNSSPQELKNVVKSHWDAKQNTTYHPEGNTLKHIITVVNRAIQKYPNNPNMILAAYFHDLGKMETYNLKDGKPTAHGHEKVSHRLVDEYSDFIVEMGGDPNIVAYIVSNHMRMKPHVWDVMRDKKKEKITKHPNFSDLEGFSKIDKGGLHLESVIRKVLKENDWDSFTNHSEDTTIKDFILREMPEFLKEYNNHTIFVELVGGEIIYIWTNDYTFGIRASGEVYDMLEVEFFSEWSEFRHNYDIEEHTLDEYLDSVGGDMSTFIDVKRMNNRYIDKLKEILPIKRGFSFENTY
jgi:hypothetical protein